MFVLHGLWRTDQRLALWAEDARPRPDQALGSAPDGHPRACGAPALAGLLSAVGPGLEWLAGDADHGEAALLLPSRDGAPLPSPEAAGPLAAPTARGARLTAWRVPTLEFGAGQAAQLLGELFDPRHAALQPDLPGTGPVETPYGASLRWLTQVHDLAWRLVGRGLVLPALSHEPDGAHARWTPTPDAEARREAAALAADCPPVCRAEVLPDTTGGAAAPARGGAAIVAELLAALVDAEVQAVLVDRPPLLPSSRGRLRPPATAAEHWLSALGSIGGRVRQAEEADLAVLEQRLTAWHRSATGVPGPLRLGFRLVEPQGTDAVDVDGEPDADRWRLEFTVQVVDDPSVVVEASALWAGAAAAAPLAGLVDRPEAALGAELERAARCRPELEPGLLAHRPGGMGLDRAGALDFLREAAPALAASGFTVLLPAWWRRPAALGLGLTASAVQAGVVEQQSLLGKDDMVEFRWQAVLGEQPLSAQELAALAATKETLVRVRGQWFEADQARIAAAVAFLERSDQGVVSAAELLRIALGGMDGMDGVGGTGGKEPGSGLPILSVQGEGPLGELLRRVRVGVDAAAARSEERASGAPASGESASGESASGAPASEEQAFEPVVVPPGFGAVLRPYQERGVAWLAFLARLGLGGVLADDMGLGKTVQTLALLAVEHAESDPSPGPTLVIAPMSLVGNWTRECARFTPELRVHVHHGAGRPDGAELRRAVAGADIVITTYGLVVRDFEALRAIGWHRLVADEAHYLKNSASRQSRAVRALPATHRLALTGTPVQNRLAELHSLLDLVNPGMFGSAERFKERYSVPIERNASDRATAELRRRTRPFVLRRVKTDPAVAVDLPRKQEMTVLCNLTAEQAALYRAVVDDLLLRMERSRIPRYKTSGTTGFENRGLVLAALTRLKQICNHPAQYTGERGPDGRPRLAGRSGKLARLEETLEEAVAEGDRTLAFTQYREFGALLQPYLSERLDSEVLFLHGGMTKRQRDAAVDRFQDPDGPSVFLLSLRAGGVGLNLTAANQVVHLDRWWNPAVEEQATDRAFRLGQQRDVQVRRFVSAGTVEERVDAMIEAKRRLADAVVGSGESWLTTLSAEALREVLTLTEDAVSEADA
ncbi:SNF2-related protein [Streptacidiphilus sp. EB129]|uniref:SNF2-related protein n=1 Tax=Streptacidiphilus sp. EB129 TaxID=3156262 RepID=UPI0035169B0C